MYQCINKNQKVITASKGLPRKNGYCCPQCLKELHLCAGKIRAPYFAHTFNESCKHKDEKLEVIDQSAQKRMAIKTQVMKIINKSVSEIFDVLEAAA